MPLPEQDRSRWDRNSDRGRTGARPPLPTAKRARAVPDPSRDQRRPQRRTHRRRDRLEPDPRALRPAPRDHPHSDRRAQPRRRGRRARRATGRTRPDRQATPRRLLPLPRDPRRPPPTPRPQRPSRSRVPRRDRAHRQRRRDRIHERADLSNQSCRIMRAHLPSAGPRSAAKQASTSRTATNLKAGLTRDARRAPLLATCGEHGAGPGAPARRRTGGSRSELRSGGLSDRTHHAVPGRGCLQCRSARRRLRRAPAVRNRNSVQRLVDAQRLHMHVAAAREDGLDRRRRSQSSRAIVPTVPERTSASATER